MESRMEKKQPGWGPLQAPILAINDAIQRTLKYIVTSKPTRRSTNSGLVHMTYPHSSVVLTSTCCPVRVFDNRIEDNTLLALRDPVKDRRIAKILTAEQRGG